MQEGPGHASGGHTDTQHSTGLRTGPCIGVFVKRRPLRSNVKEIVRKASEGTVPVPIRIISVRERHTLDVGSKNKEH